MKRLSQTFKLSLAAFLGVFSSGIIQLYVAPNAAAAAQKIIVCHATSSATNTFVAIQPDKSSNHIDLATGVGTDEHTEDFLILTEIDTNLNWSSIHKDLDDECAAENPSTPLTAPAVTFADPCETENDKYTIPFSSEYIAYYVNGSLQATAAGTYTATGTVSVEAKALNNRTLTGTKTWSQTFSSITCEEPDTLTPCVEWDSVHATNLDHNGWTLDEGASFVDGGLKLSVDGEWAKTTARREIPGTLKDLGTGIDFTPGTQYLGIHVETSNGTLVYEQEPSYDGKWWSNDDFNVESGMGYTTFDTLKNIVAANPDVTLKSFSILYTNPSEAETTVTSVKIGCAEYTFDYEEAPTVPKPSKVEYQLTACVANTNSTDVLRVRVMNTADNTEDDVEYTVTVTPEIGAAITKQVTVADGEESTVVFENLPAGEYVIDISATDETEFESEYDTIDQCTVTPGSGSGNGHTLGGATDVKTPTVLPTTIPATGANGVQNQLVIVLAALTAYGATFFFQNRRKLSANEA